MANKIFHDLIHTELSIRSPPTPDHLQLPSAPQAAPHRTPATPGHPSVFGLCSQLPSSGSFPTARGAGSLRVPRRVRYLTHAGRQRGPCLSLLSTGLPASRARAATDASRSRPLPASAPTLRSVPTNAAGLLSRHGPETPPSACHENATPELARTTQSRLSPPLQPASCIRAPGGF